jgi:hypothetical protein
LAGVEDSPPDDLGFQGLTNPRVKKVAFCGGPAI